ncbi:dTDP-glucose 4,6-dehydratase [Candidatus Falkowbacteria bacterium RIFOXYB2_FULL_34_18]|uniref:dTDP-glucose 4,6-dehydratase n=1 Tax=Candidatus Falkowbacteria bacterium RIFOXYD2_FULL_34_120 TaxID=1798007 RepID=A0A1F5TM67_9BACT|nr:MAG: dTDP-glucose 4,6-dehydratase [Candidatus Falkowbacteria bacterium RIFOXYB2_FULL_34_18]OGF30274.1 MAG: dTDP-glucose 4,6-dehydratase [Candidatus Falkowbacteria bacterium RIFOXYC12_FULL_34_55]OGF37825.1 MAG: dTDP-glucose 4,6-dehydratase [Candidatus Falkowbacteria bacterium RIFOXYC2_FULL_34_220]OGF39586.1 MAG: dTDP-glucose 4,6-dehydratase [Candidatus Falkowbacteria bacterium RIFOXYD12_FULL_34_57]OGF40010.1 MAG: dTDP-glucose 4,6-dehydratase [Candidatus Falkowbacteria bacterium RIFOXYD2_FULL_
MKILVTGGAGFIGSNFIHYWLGKHPDDNIINLDLLTYAGNLENLKEIEHLNNYEFVRGDICDRDLVNDLVKKVDLIVHFAAESHVDRSVFSPRKFVDTNIAGTHNLLEAARNTGGVRFHHISTDEVYGHLGPNDPPFNEKTPYAPRSPYSASKAASDMLVQVYFTTYKLPITISHCSNNYGRFQFPEKLIPLIITNLMLGKKIPLYGDGKQIRDWIHVDDHNRGVETIIEKGRIGDTYCLGGNNEVTNIDIARMILDIMGHDEDKIEHVADRPGHDVRYAIDFSKINKELNWEPKIDFQKGLREKIKWMIENEQWWRRIRSGEYQDYYKQQYG